MRNTQTARTLAALAAAVFLAACASATRRATTVESGGEVSNASVIPANNRPIPVGAERTAPLDQTLGTKESKAGDPFSATVITALRAQDGSMVVPSGAKIEGRVTATDPSDNATKPALIRLAFDRIRFNGQSYPFSAAIIQSNPVQTGQPTAAERNKQIVIGGAVGA